MLLVALAAALAGGLAAPAPARADDVRMEATFAFAAGQSDQRDAPWSYHEGDGSQAAVGVFAGAPLARVQGRGPLGEIRLVDNGVRLSYGIEKVYMRPGPADAAQLAAGGDAVRSLGGVQHLYAMGYEHRVFGPVVAFADLVGIGSELEAKVLTGQQQATYRAETFDFALRGGVRVPISRCAFIHVEGLFGIDGQAQRGISIGLGLGTPSD